MSRVDPVRLFLAIFFYYCSFPVRGLRWRLLLRNVGFNQAGEKEIPSLWTLARFMVMGWFANCLLPAKLGDAYRAFLAKREMGASFSKMIGTVLAERVIDITVVFFLLVVASLAVVGYAQAEAAMWIILVGLGLVLAMGAAMVALARFGDVLQRRLPERFKRIYQLFHEGTFRSFRNLPAIASLSVLVWLAEATRVYFVSWSLLGYTLDPGLILFVALTDALLVGIPFVPGGLGLVEAGLIAMFMLVVTKEQAASIALLDRVLSYWSVLMLGGLLHLWGIRGIRARRNRLHVGY